MALLEIKDLVVRYGEIEALRSVSLKVERRAGGHAARLQRRRQSPPRCVRYPA